MRTKIIGLKEYFVLRPCIRFGNLYTNKGYFEFHIFTHYQTFLDRAFHFLHPNIQQVLWYVRCIEVWSIVWRTKCTDICRFSINEEAKNKDGGVKHNFPGTEKNSRRQTLKNYGRWKLDLSYSWMVKTNFVILPVSFLGVQNQETLSY